MTFPFFSRRALMLLLAALWLGWLPATGAQAAVVCTATMTALNFGTVDLVDGSTPAEATATLSYECTNDATAIARTHVCFNIGDGNQSLGFFNPRRMTAGGTDALQFQLYLGTSTVIWGSNGNPTVPTPFAVDLSIPARNGSSNGRTPGIATMRGVLVANQGTTPPGIYQDDFNGVHTSITYTSTTGTPMPTTCATSSADNFGFVVSATVSKSCVVTANPLNFGNVDGLPGATNVDVSSTISVTCSRPTPYSVALTPSNNSTSGAGVMLPTIAGNTDTVAYRLYSNSSRTTVWGDVVGTNTVPRTGTDQPSGTGTGTGLAQGLTVYGRVLGASVNVRPDDYRDTVTVKVTY